MSNENDVYSLEKSFLKYIEKCQKEIKITQNLMIPEKYS